VPVLPVVVFFKTFHFQIIFKMQDVVAPVHNITFDIEIALNNQIGAHPLPFPGMDS